MPFRLPVSGFEGIRYRDRGVHRPNTPPGSEARIGVGMQKVTAFRQKMLGTRTFCEKIQGTNAAQFR